MYEPEPFSGEANVEDLTEHLERELRRVAIAFAYGAQAIHLDELHAPPAKPRAGEIVLADGTDWNPGSGAGYYGYRGGAWVFLG